MKKLLGELYDVVFAYQDVCEIRLAVDCPVKVVTRGRTHSTDVVCTRAHLDRCLSVASDYSVYTVVSRLVDGYLPYTGGVRIGVAGRYGVQAHALHALQSVSGLVIRLPHAVEGCSRALPLSRVMGSSVLVVSPPFCGKTTFVRDLAARLSHLVNVVVLDEREEISLGGVRPVGEAFTLSGAPKDLLYRGVLRALNPTYVVTDELDLPRDLEVVRYLAAGGVSVVATVHGDRTRFADASLSAVFPVRVLLSSAPSVGHVEEIAYA